MTGLLPPAPPSPRPPGPPFGPPPGPADADWALFLDIDGTLLDLAPRPEAVVVPAALPPLLDTLTHHLSGALALVSGRSLDGIDRLFPGRRDAAGSHGAEWRQDAREHSLPADWLAGLLPRLGRDIALPPGLRLEPKACALALHYPRHPAAEPQVRRLAERLAALSPERLRILAGKQVIELLPDGIDKGQAIERFLALPPYAGRRPVFVGDDRTDEDGFAAVNRRDGISVKVGPEPTAARHRLASPAEVRHWLAGLAPPVAGDPA